MGHDVPGSLVYDPDHIDMAITKDSIVIDAYIDHPNDDSSSYVYIILTEHDLGTLKAGTYRFDRGNHTRTIASQRYPFSQPNSIYFVDTGSVTIQYINIPKKLIEIEFDFSVNAGVIGENRFVRGKAYRKPLE